MKGLLLKDILTMKASWRVYGLMAAVYAVLSFTGTYTMFSYMMALLMLILPLSSFSADELARWDKFAVSLPGGRRAVVWAKYQFLFLTLAATFVLSLAVNLLLTLVGRGEISDLTVESLGCIAAGLLMNGILYPLLFKFGSQKSRIMIAIIFGVVFAFIGMGMAVLKMSGQTLTDLSLPGWFSPVSFGILAVVVLVAALAISYRISLRIYDKKEF